MHPRPPLFTSWVKNGISAALAAAAMFLAGCALDRIGNAGRPQASCPMSSILYCDVEPRPGMPSARCRCIRSAAVSDMLETLSRR